MPGAGKSTVGIILAKLTSRNFIDTDVLIQISQGRFLQDVVDKEGYVALRRIEEEILLGLHCYNHVIATGGSAVYSHVAMEYLKLNGSSFFSMWIYLHWNREFMILTREPCQTAGSKFFRPV
jgi:shikimate kinase